MAIFYELFFRIVTNIIAVPILFYDLLKLPQYHLYFCKNNNDK